MERPDFFTLKNGEKVKLPFSNNEYNERVDKLRKTMDKNNLGMVILTSMHNIAYYTGFIYCSFGRPYACIISDNKISTISANIDASQPWRRSHCENVIYTDTLSVKSSILNTLKTLDRTVLERFVLSHPIAGSEQSGFKASSATLFKQKLSIICPHEDNSELDVSKVEEFWKALGSYTKKLSANDHDELFGKTSHMPHVIAYALMDSLYQDLGEKTFLYSGGSLEDYTRIASSDPIMWKDIMVSNDKSILSSIESFKSSLDKLSELIETNNATGLIEFFRTVKNARDKSISGKKD